MGVYQNGALKTLCRKRLVIAHEQAELTDTPRFLLTGVLPWEGGRVIRVWSDRWPVEIFPEFCQPAVGLEASSVRQEEAEAVQRHFRWSGVAPSRLQRLPAAGKKSERFTFVEEDQPTIDQKLYTLTRDALGQWLHLVQELFAQGQP